MYLLGTSYAELTENVGILQGLLIKTFQEYFLLLNFILLLLPPLFIGKLCTHSVGLEPMTSPSILIQRKYLIGTIIGF
jgi:hypothetical protein